MEREGEFNLDYRRKKTIYWVFGSSGCQQVRSKKIYNWVGGGGAVVSFELPTLSKNFEKHLFETDLTESYRIISVG